MRERGTQSRQTRGPRVDPMLRRPGPPRPPRRTDPWQVVAIVAIIIAAGGWTLAAVFGSQLASGPSAAAVETESPDESFDESESSDDVAPIEQHDAPDLEAALPTTIKGTPLKTESTTGATILLDNDTWSNTIRTFLSSVGKTPDDLREATAYDPTEVLQDSIAVYQVPGVSGATLRDALVNAWKVDYPDLKVVQVTLGGKTVTKLDFEGETVDSYMVVEGEYVYDVETTDDTVAATAFAALPKPGASGAPAGSPGPAGSTPPASKPPVTSAAPS